MAYEHPGHRPQYAEPSVSPVVPTFSHVSAAQQLRYHGRHDAYDLSHPLVSPIMSRSPSLVSSDRFSNVSALTNQFPSSPSNIRPAPAYVAAFGAAQVVSEQQLGAKRHLSDDDDEDDATGPSVADAQFSPAALALVNAFLDQLLYSILAHAKSTSLTALRPAVTEVLRSRLASEAITSAQEELKELLAGGDEEDDMDAKQSAAEQTRGWDLELVWKRTRLRVMVYIRLGDMEDDDEERYVRDEDLFHGSERRFSQTSGLVSWAAAIFLTSVLEHVAEQILRVAGQAAYHRARRQSRVARAAPGTVTPADGVTVEDHDVEKVALNAALGRLWRTWRKTSRSSSNPAMSSPTAQHFHVHKSSRESIGTATDGRRGSFSTAPESMPALEESRPASQGTNTRDSTGNTPDEIPEPQYPEHVLAANIPLPIGEAKRDVDEIEVPGLAIDPDEVKVDDDENNQQQQALRRRSLQHSTALQTDEQAPIENASQAVVEAKPKLTRQRSNSHPGRGKNFSTHTDVPILNHVVGEGHESMQERESEELRDAKASTETDPALQDDGSAQKRGSARFLEGAVAGATALAATAASVVMGSKAKEQSSTTSLSDERNVEELDRQKHLLDADRKNPLRQQSQKPESDVPLAGTSNGEPNEHATAPVEQGSTDADEERGGDPPLVPHPERGAEEPVPSLDQDQLHRDDVGIAKTLDTAIPTPQSQSTQESEVIRARDADSDHLSSKRPSRIFLSDDSSAPSALSSPADKIDSQTDAHEADRGIHGSDSHPESRLAREGQTQPQTSTEPAHTPSRQVSQRSGKSVGQDPPDREKSQWRKSLSAVIDRSRSKSRSRSTSVASNSREVQEHPIVQRMASMKKNAGGKADDEPGVPLTSASIKGPQDFDMFVQGGDTVKYTLTPENVRDEPESLKATPESKPSLAPSSAKVSAGEHRTPSPVRDARTGRSLASEPATAADSQEVDGNVSSQEVSAERTPKSEKRRSFSRPSTRNTSTHRNGLTAREPQVMTQSTRDIADFIRSTGPATEQEVIPIFKNRSTTSLQSLRNGQMNGSRATSPGGRSTRSLKSSTAQSAIVPPVPPMPSARNKASMQPRGATTASEGSADLIDFIRSGPADTGQRRIPRTVAPFRTTMDSDQMKNWGDKAGPPDARGPANGPAITSSQSASSIKSSNPASMHSRAPLLNGTSNANEIVHPAHSGAPPSLSGQARSAPAAAEDGRKRYRNKDPYAAYLDDLDDGIDDGDVTALPNQPRQEESLIDFLNATEHLDSTRPQRTSSGNVLSSKSNGSTANRRSSVQPLSSHSSSGFDSGPSRRGSMPNGPAAREGITTHDLRPTPLLGNTSTVTGPLSRPKMEARNPNSYSGVSNSTKDLADFFRNSGPASPPGDPLSAPAPNVGRKAVPPSSSRPDKKDAKKKGFFSFFSRGSGRKTYLDM